MHYKKIITLVMDRKQRLKELIHRYDQLNEQSRELYKMKKQIVAELKELNMTKCRFDFGDHSLKYCSFNDYEGITQKLIRETISREYPQVDAQKLTTKIAAGRKKRVVETFRRSAVQNIKN